MKMTCKCFHSCVVMSCLANSLSNPYHPMEPSLESRVGVQFIMKYESQVMFTFHINGDIIHLTHPKGHLYLMLLMFNQIEREKKILKEEENSCSALTIVFLDCHWLHGN